MFRRKAFTRHCVGDSRFDLVDGRKLENRRNRCDLGLSTFNENFTDLLQIYYKFFG
jgi:hypothetical protein